MVKVHPINVGQHWTDGGAAFGVLPRPMWEKAVTPDEKHRIPMAGNLLLIESGGHLILVDTGLGTVIDEKTRKINSPDPYQLDAALAVLGIVREDIDLVVLTHLHFDHVGGLIEDSAAGLQLAFPHAEHLVQRREWEMAEHPDILNAASYNFPRQLSLLAEKGSVRLLDGDEQLTKDVSLVVTGGHTVGFQAVRIDDGHHLWWFAGDLFPTEVHLRPHLTMSYDVNREATVAAKLRILTELDTRKGTLFFSHDTQAVAKTFE